FGSSDAGATGQMDIYLTNDTTPTYRSPAAPGSSFISYCVDLNDTVLEGQTFDALPTTAVPGLVNGQEIAYLFNEYGTTNPLSTSTHVANNADKAEALQEAIWELEYGANFSPDFHGSLTVQNEYNFYLSDAQGKDEAADYLDATLGGIPGQPPLHMGAQGVLATESYNFKNVPAPTDANITITPNGFNEIGHNHTFTVTVQENTGSGFVPAPNEPVTVTLTNSNGATAAP